MKILIYRYGSICEPDIIDTFTELGHAVSQITNEITDKTVTAKQTLNLVSSFLLDHPQDAIFTINFYPIISETCKIFNIPYLCWIVDSPVMTLYSHSITNKCNRIFLFDRALYNEFHQYNQTGIFYLPLATNAKHMQEVISSASSSMISKFTSDVSFVGSLYSEKCAYNRLTNPSNYLSGYLTGLMEAQLKVYGYFFIEDLLTDDIVKDFKEHLPGFYEFPENTFKNHKACMAQLYLGNKISAIERERAMLMISSKYNTDIYTGSDTSNIPLIHNKGLVKTLTEMPIVFKNSTINLNITSKSIRTGLPLRIWDILGCNGFLITNYQAELPEYFTIGEDIEAYGSLEELEEKIAFYLDNTKKCREIADNAYENIISNHTYLLRVSELLDIAFGRREPRL